MLEENRLSQEMIAECKKKLSLRAESLKDLSIKTDVSYGYVRQIMSGRRCSDRAKQKICDYLGIEIANDEEA